MRNKIWQLYFIVGGVGIKYSRHFIILVLLILWIMKPLQFKFIRIEIVDNGFEMTLNFIKILYDTRGIG